MFDKYVDYAKETSTTAIYEEDFYPFLGLAGELGEAMSYMGTHELGDILWYAAQCLRITFDDAVGPAVFASFATSLESAARSSLAKDRDYYKLQTLLKAVAAVEVCKKAIRSKTPINALSSEGHSVLVDAVAAAIAFVCDFCASTGIELLGIMSENLKKLRERQRAGEIAEHD